MPARTIQTKIDWLRYRATLRKFRKPNICKVCGEQITGQGYSVTLWNSGLSGRIHPDYVCQEHIEEYIESHNGGNDVVTKI